MKQQISLRILSGLLMLSMLAWSASVFAETEETSRAVALEEGQTAPFSGVLLSPIDLAVLEKEMEALEETNAALNKNLEEVRVLYSNSIDEAYRTFDTQNSILLAKIEAIETTPVVIDETEWWEPVVWVGTGAAIVGVTWGLNAAL